ncbi:hypothetical protein AGMMS50276_26370 [Synergistales bacterium]|nr:hypothetical protein AGMMS50276_26370 [Synergistales bacterium]
MSMHPSDVWLENVRIKIHEKTKDMTAEEYVAYFNASGEAVAKEFPNIKLISPPIICREPPQKTVSE